MAFKQYYYTSCEKGIQGGKGFQVNAVTPGIPIPAMECLERIADYTPPYDLPKRPTPEQIRQDFPVSLSFFRLESGEGIVARTAYVGKEYVSGDRPRMGNFFCHALITITPEDDLTDTLPIGLWDARFWSVEPSTKTDLPELSSLSGLSDKMSRGSIIEALRGEMHPDVCASMAAAVLSVMSSHSDKRIVILGSSRQIVLCVAAISFILPRKLALDMSFNTYSIRPQQTSAIICGARKDTDFTYTDVDHDAGFFVFDFQEDRFSRLEANEFTTEAAFALFNGDMELLDTFSVFYSDMVSLSPAGGGAVDEMYRFFKAGVRGEAPGLDSLRLIAAHATPALLEKYPEITLNISEAVKVLDQENLDTETAVKVATFLKSIGSSRARMDGMDVIRIGFIAGNISVLSHGGINELGSLLPPEIPASVFRDQDFTHRLCTQLKKIHGLKSKVDILALFSRRGAFAGAREEMNILAEAVFPYLESGDEGTLKDLLVGEYRDAVYLALDRCLSGFKTHAGCGEKIRIYLKVPGLRERIASLAFKADDAGLLGLLFEPGKDDGARVQNLILFLKNAQEFNYAPDRPLLDRAVEMIWGDLDVSLQEGANIVAAVIDEFPDSDGTLQTEVGETAKSLFAGTKFIGNVGAAFIGAEALPANFSPLSNILAVEAVSEDTKKAADLVARVSAEDLKKDDVENLVAELESPELGKYPGARRLVQQKVCRFVLGDTTAESEWYGPLVERMEKTDGYGIFIDTLVDMIKTGDAAWLHAVKVAFDCFCPEEGNEKAAFSSRSGFLEKDLPDILNTMKDKDTDRLDEFMRSDSAVKSRWEKAFQSNAEKFRTRADENAWQRFRAFLRSLSGR